MAAIVATPLLHGSDAIELSGGTWRKRVLPVGTIDYKGRSINFDRSYLTTLADSFNRRAYDQVPFQIADHANTHTNDPERTRGWVTGMSVNDDGLWVEVETTDAGNQLLASNPRLGVSARIVEDYLRADGQHFPVALQHVLGTLDPRITELGPWQSVEMSNGGGSEPDMIIDLSGGVWVGEPGYEAANDGYLTAAELANLTDDEREVYGQGDPLVFAEYVMGKHRAVTLANDGSDDNGLTARGQGIYKKLCSKGVKPAIALAMAKRAQNVKPGAQLSNADDFSEQGALIEMAAQQAAQRQAEDAEPPRRRDEDRLAVLLGRVQRGSYRPGVAERNLGFANDGYGSYGMGCSCGATSGDGRTVSTTHLAGCEHALSSDDQAAYVTSGVYGEIATEPFTDARGTTWRDQNGQQMTLSDHIEALTGQRVARSPFEGLGRTELAAPQRDFDGGVRGLAAAMGLGDHRAARDEARQRGFDRMVQRPATRYRTIGEAMDHGESTRERAERLRQPMGTTGVVTSGWDDGLSLPGELTGMSRY